MADLKRKAFLYLYLVLWLAYPCGVLCLSDCALLLGEGWTALRIQRLLNGFAVLDIAGLAALWVRKNGWTRWRKVLLGLGAVGMALLLVCVNGVLALLDGTQEYHTFHSPDGGHTIVVSENVSLIAGQVTLYERVSPFLIQPRDRVSTDDGFRPVCAGKYALRWQGDMVTLTVSDGMGGEETLSADLKDS